MADVPAPADPAAPARRTAWWARPRLLVPTTTALALVATLVVLDQSRLDAEQSEVQACSTGAVDALALADSRLSAMATYVAPAQVPDPEEDAADQTGLVGGLMGRAATEARPGVATAAATCGAVDVRPWHPGTASRRDNLVAYLDARVAQLDRITETGQGYDRPPAALEELAKRAFPASAVD